MASNSHVGLSRACVLPEENDDSEDADNVNGTKTGRRRHYDDPPDDTAGDNNFGQDFGGDDFGEDDLGDDAAGNLGSDNRSDWFDATL